MNSLGLQPNVDLGPTHTSVAALILDLVRRLSRIPGHQLVHAQPHLSNVSGSWWNDAAPNPGSQVFRGPVARAFTTLLESSIVSQFNRPADIPSTVIEDQLAAAILQLRSTYRRFDEALRIETLTQALLDRPQDADQVYAAFSTTEFHLEVMRRTGWSPRLVQDGSSSASSTDHAGGVPVYPVSNETLRSVLFVMAMLAQPSPSPTQAVPDIIPSAAAVAVESSTSHASSVLLTSGAFSSLSAISSNHSSASLQNATSDVTGFLDYSDLVRNASLRTATHGDPWRVVYSESSMHVPNQPPASTLDRQWDASALGQLPPIGSGLGGPTRVHELVQPTAATPSPLGTGSLSTAGLFAPALGTHLSVPALDESARFSVLDWLPSVPESTGVPSGPSPSDPSSWFPTSLSSFSSTSRPPLHTASTGARSTAGSSQALTSSSIHRDSLAPSTTLRPWAGLDSTETWELAHPSRSLSMIPQPDRAASPSLPFGPQEGLTADPWIRAGDRLDPSAHTRTELLSWDTSVPRGALTSTHPALLPTPPISIFTHGAPDLISPFLTESSTHVQIALMDRAMLSAPDPADLISEPTLALHIYQLVCGIESQTFRWLGMPTLMQVATDTADTSAPLKFGYARGRAEPPRVRGLSPGALCALMPRFFAIGSALRRLELAAVDLRTRIREVGFTGCALARVLDEVVAEVREKVIAWRKQPGGLRLRTCWARMATLEEYVGRLCAALGSTESDLYRVDWQGLALVAQMAMVAYAADVDGFAVEGGFPNWQHLAFLGTLRPMLRWLQQWLTGRDAWQSGLLWDTTDPHREFPVVWVDRGPTEENPHAPVWSTGFQVRADYVKAPLDASGILPPAFLERLIDTHKVANTLVAVGQFGSVDRSFEAPSALFAWTADLQWPTTFDAMQALLASHGVYAQAVINHLAACAKRIVDADDEATRATQSLHEQSNQSRKRHVLEWAAQRRTAKEQVAARKRALMTELRALSELRAKMAVEERAKEAFVEAQRVKAHLQSAERWGRLVEREKARLLGEYEEKVKRARKEAERLEWRRKRLELGGEREKIGRAGLIAEQGQNQGMDGRDSVGQDAGKSDAIDIDEPVHLARVRDDTAQSPAQVDPGLIPLPVSATEDERKLLSLPTEPMEVDPQTVTQTEEAKSSTSGTDMQGNETRGDSADAMRLEPIPYAWSTFTPSGLISFTCDPSTLNPHVPRPAVAPAAVDDASTHQAAVPDISTTPGNNASTEAPTTAAATLFVNDTLVSSTTGAQGAQNKVSRLSYAMANTAFYRNLTSNLALSEYALLASLLAQPDLLDQLATLPQVFCLRDANIRHSLLQVLLPNALGSGPSPDIEFGLARVLDMMPGFGVSTIMPHDISTDPYDPHLFDFLNVAYTPSAPLWILITPDAITIYNALLRFLVRIQYLDHATKSLFRSVRDLWKLHIPSAQYPPTIAETLDAIRSSMSAIDHLLGRFQTEAQHTTNALWSYASDVAVGETWDAFEQVVDRARFGVTQAAGAKSAADLLDQIDGGQGEDNDAIRSVKQLHNAHMRMVESMHFRCLLRRAQRPIQEAIDAQIRAVLTVEHVTREYVGLREKYLRMQYRQATTGGAGADGGTRTRTVRFVGQLAPGIDALRDKLDEVFGKVQESAETFRTYNRRIVSVLKSVEERSAGTGYVVVKQGAPGKVGGGGWAGVKASGLSDLLVKLDFNGFFGGKADVGIANRL